MDHGCVVASPELPPDLGQRGVGQLARQVHGHLPRIRDSLRAPRAHELVERDPEPLGDRLLDPRDGHLGCSVALREDVLQHVLSEIDGHRAVGQRRERDHARQRALELPDVRGDSTGDEGQDVGLGDRDVLGVDLLAQDGDPGLEVGGLDVGQEPPLEARAEPLLERCDLPRRAIGGDDDLRAALVQRVERVEELLLDPLLAFEELDVVDEEHVEVAVPALEALDSLVPQRVDEVVHERLARHVAHRQPARVLADVVADRLEQVSLPEPGAAVDEERVVCLRRRLGDCERGRVREPIRGSDHEEIEGVLRIELDLGRVAEMQLRLACARLLGNRPGRAGRKYPLGHRERDRDVVAERLACRAGDEALKVALDPVPGEVVRNRDLEPPVDECPWLGVREPRVVSRFADRLPEPPGDHVPETVSSWFGQALHPSSDSLELAGKGRA